MKEGRVSESRIDESVRRILQTKEWLGLLEDPLRAQVFATPGLLESVGSAEDKAASLAVARESIVLLKNERAADKNRSSSSRERDPVLPFKRGTRLLVTGPGCSSLSHQMGRWSIVLFLSLQSPFHAQQRRLTSSSLVNKPGGWSVHWQGAADREFGHGSTIVEELRRALGAGNVTLVEEGGSRDRHALDKEEGKEGGGFHMRRPPRGLGQESKGSVASFRERLVEAARSAAVDAIVACVGEGPYAEKPGDIDALDLDGEQAAVVKALKAATGKPLVVVLVEGRARLLDGLPAAADAVVHAMLPGPFGGQAVAEVLLGETNPSGRLPLTYPKTSGTALHSYMAKVRCVSRELSGV